MTYITNNWELFDLDYKAANNSPTWQYLAIVSFIVICTFALIRERTSSPIPSLVARTFEVERSLK